METHTLFPSQCGFRCCSHWLGGTGIINSGAGCIYFKTLLRVCMGADGITAGGHSLAKSTKYCCHGETVNVIIQQRRQRRPDVFSVSRDVQHWSVWAARPCRSAVKVQPLLSVFAALGRINNFMQAKLQLSVYDSEHSFILGWESHCVCMAVFLSGSYI